MFDDFKTAITALANFYQDMEAINRFAKPFYMRVIEKLECTKELIRRPQ